MGKPLVRATISLGKREKNAIFPEQEYLQKKFRSSLHPSTRWMNVWQQGEGNQPPTGKQRGSGRLLLPDRWPLRRSPLVGWVCNNPMPRMPFCRSLSSEHPFPTCCCVGRNKAIQWDGWRAPTAVWETLVQWGLHADMFCLFMQLMKTCSLDRRPETQPGRRMDGIQPCIIQVGEWKPVSAVSTPKWYSGCGYVSS